MQYIFYNGELYHHGVQGQKWGVRNAEWYPIDEWKASQKSGRDSGSFKKTEGEKRQHILDYANAETILKNKKRYNYTVEEITVATKRIEAENNLKKASFNQKTAKIQNASEIAKAGTTGINFVSALVKLASQLNEDSGLPSQFSDKSIKDGERYIKKNTEALAKNFDADKLAKKAAKIAKRQARYRSTYMSTYEPMAKMNERLAGIVMPSATSIERLMAATPNLDYDAIINTLIEKYSK